MVALQQQLELEEIKNSQGQDAKKFVDFVKRHGQSMHTKNASLFNHYQYKQVKNIQYQQIIRNL